MAVKLSDALLGFAGGAADAFNVDVEKRRESDRRMIENANNLLNQTQLKAAETKFTNDYKTEATNKIVRERIKGVGGTGTTLGQYIYARDILGLEGTQLEAAVTAGLPVPEDFMTSKTVEMPGGDLFSELAGSVTTKQGRRRATELREKFANLAPDVTEAEKMGLPPEGVPPSILQAHEESLKKALFERKPVTETDILKDGTVVNVLKDPRTGQIISREFLKPEGGEAGVGEERTTNIISLQNERTLIEQEIRQQEAAGGDTRDLQRRLAEVNTKIEKDITITGRTPEDVEIKLRAERTLGELRNRESATNTALTSLNRLESLSTESAGGITGWITSFTDMVGTQVRGMTDALGATQSLTIADRRKALEGAGLNYDELLESNSAVYKGLFDTERVNMLYSIASVFRETGRRDISNADVERAESVINMIGNGKLEGATRMLRQQINRRIREVNLSIYELEGTTPTEKLRAGINWLQTERVTPDGRTIPPAVPGVDYIIKDGVIGIPGPNDTIRTLDEYLLSNPEARRI